MYTIHLPYSHGLLSVTLVLGVKPPGEEYKVFGLQDFSQAPDLNKE